MEMQKPTSVAARGLIVCVHEGCLVAAPSLALQVFPEGLRIPRCARGRGNASQDRQGEKRGSNSLHDHLLDFDCVYLHEPVATR